MLNMMTEPRSDKTAPLIQPILWIDGVGGYLLIDRNEVSLGQAIAGSSVDVGIVGDLRRQAAVIRRLGSDYLLQPLQPDTRLNGESVDRAQLLTGDDVIQFGQRMRLQFSKPNPLSATARLKLPGHGRFQPHVDAVLLLADSCILGPGPGSHVICPEWSSDLLLIRRGQGWVFRALEKVEVNGRSVQGQIEMVAGLRMRGDNFSLSIE